MVAMEYLAEVFSGIFCNAINILCNANRFSVIQIAGSLGFGVSVSPKVLVVLYR